MPIDKPSAESLNITDTLDEVAWWDFVDRHPQGNIFHTPEMFQVFARTKGYRPELQAALGNDGQILALLFPVQITLKDGLFHHLTTRSIAYGSVLCTPDAAGREALAALLRTYNRRVQRNVLMTELRHLSDFTPCQSVFIQCGYTYHDQLNYLIDLECPTEELFNRIGSRTRKHIRHELNRGQVVVEEVNDAGKIGFWYEVIKKTYQAARVPIADISLFESAFNVLHPRNMIKFWLARMGDDYIASSVELLYKDVVYGWYGGVDRAFSKYAPSEVLTWHIIKWAAKKGYRVYDFGGAGSPDEEYGVRDFKAKFGGQLVCYGRNIKVYSPALLSLSKLGYKVLRRFLNR